ncbi:MAG: hypothetical protein HQ594_06590 [Candidatus Omnitrophica bacterium]|nr:hypothetical protein [Candidatus Omnitrophota bacterium]
MLEDLNKRTQRLSVVDIGLLKWCMIVIGLIVAKFFPELLQVSYIKLIAIAVILGMKPLYVFWIKK